MYFVPVEFPWKFNQFQNWLTVTQLQAHYEKNYKNYINNLNKIASEKPELKNQTKLNLMLSYPCTEIFNNAAQAINHEFFWFCFSPNQTLQGNYTSNFINQSFGSFTNFKDLFVRKCKDHFGSGWCWLVYDPILNNLRIIDTHDSYNPLMDNLIPLLTLDLWEHSFYIDYLTDKESYTLNFFKYINWNFVEDNLKKINLSYS